VQSRFANLLIAGLVVGATSLVFIAILLPCEMPFRGHHSWQYRFHIIYWAPPLLGVVGAALDDRDRQRRRKQQTEMNCRKCGYNLTTNASGVCPECGTKVTAKNGINISN
jgi:hypothetical protein